MGYFSKQWCEIVNKHMPDTFDIDGIAENMNRHSYKNVTCEGIGFSKMYKDQYERLWLGFKKDDDGFVWKPYKTVIASEKAKANENSNIQRYS